MEDTGELLAADAKQQAGQGLSRLLNVVDGLLGESSQALFLVPPTRRHARDPSRDREARPLRPAPGVRPLGVEEANLGSKPTTQPRG